MARVAPTTAGTSRPEISRSKIALIAQGRQLRGILRRPRDWESLAIAFCFSARQMAGGLNVSLRHLQRHFRLVYDEKLQDWLDRVRLVVAYELLVKSDNVKEVAFQLGFKQQSHFSKVFKQFHGFPPSFIVRHKPGNQLLRACGKL